MITDKDITQAGEQEKRLAETYLKGIIDFVKWSSTLAIAAILWIGGNISSIAELSWRLSVVSLIFLVGSLVIAVLAIKYVLAAWASEWDIAREDYAFSLFKKWKAFKASEQKPNEIAEMDRKEQQQIDRLLNALDAAKPFSEPKRFSSWVSWHIILLIVGLFIYALAQVLSKL